TDELILRAAEVFEGGAQLAVRVLEILGTAHHLTLERDRERLGRTELVAQRATHLFEREGQTPDLVGVAGRDDRASGLTARHLARALLELPYRLGQVPHHDGDEPHGQSDERQEEGAERDELAVRMDTRVGPDEQRAEILRSR